MSSNLDLAVTFLMPLLRRFNAHIPNNPLLLA